AVALVPLVAPVIALLWCLVKLDGGPGFFGHQRVGRGGRLFLCWKLRTMVPDAQQRLAALLAHDARAAAEWQANYKLTADPRITRIGAFLRKSSLDELPQIWNVLLGEMSFVGPRPVTKPEMTMYRGTERAYLPHRPGVTGIWQVSGRNQVGYDHRVELDIAYLDKASMLFDIKVIAKTMLAVINLEGR
ncbi:MAG: sugar transferase, partial [Paracoccaceae bacterium]|nr:sugar transferase [Paracoccaceae bacterium]